MPTVRDRNEIHKTDVVEGRNGSPSDWAPIGPDGVKQVFERPKPSRPAPTPPAKASAEGEASRE